MQDEHIRIQSNNKTQGILENGTPKDSLDVHMFINAWDDYKSMDYTQCVSIVNNVLLKAAYYDQKLILIHDTLLWTCLISIEGDQGDLETWKCSEICA